MKRLGLIFIAAMLGACATPCPDAPSGGPIEQRFTCADGSTLQVTFRRGPESASVVQDGFPTLDLPAASTGSGFRYAADGAELRGRGDDIRWQRPGSAETICHQAH